MVGIMHFFHLACQMNPGWYIPSDKWRTLVGCMQITREHIKSPVYIIQGDERGKKIHHNIWSYGEEGTPGRMSRLAGYWLTISSLIKHKKTQCITSWLVIVNCLAIAPFSQASVIASVYETSSKLSSTMHVLLSDRYIVTKLLIKNTNNELLWQLWWGIFDNFLLIIANSAWCMASARFLWPQSTLIMSFWQT